MTRPAHRRRWHFPVVLALSLVASNRATAQQRWASLEEFLTNGIRLSPQERQAVQRGETIARMLPTTDNKDIAVLGVVQIDAPRAYLIERQKDFPASLRTATRTQAQVFSDPPVLADVQALDASDDDLKELRSCKPGSCNFKLPATDMEKFRGTVGSGGGAKAQVESYARQRIVDYVTQYRARGNAALVVYDDRGTVRASDALAAMLRDSSYVFATVPALGQYLLEYPHASLPGSTQVLFWSRDEMSHLRPVLRIAHEVIFTPPDNPEVTIVAAKQIYADHYFEAGIEALVVSDRGPTGGANGVTVVAIRRYRFDHLPSGGLLNIRGRVGSGLRDNVVADLKRLKRDTEAGRAGQTNR